MVIAVHLTALWTLAVAQPLFDLVARSPEFLTAHQAERTDLVLLIAWLMLGAPAALTILVVVARAAGARLQLAVLSAIVGALGGLIAVQAAKLAGFSSAAWLIPVAAAAVAAGAVLYARAPLARTFLSYLSLAAVAVPLVFLSKPSIRGVIAPRSASAEAGIVTGDLASVVMVVLDEVPLVSLLDGAGVIDRRHYPNVAQLARDGIWFRNATTVSDYTRWSLPAIVTGRYPRADASPSAADHPDTLFTLLGRTHRLEVAESVTRLCPALLCAQPDRPLRQRLSMIGNDLAIVYLHLVLPDDWKRDLPPLTDDWAHFGAAGDAHRQVLRDDRRRRATARQRGEDETLRLRDRTTAFRQFIEGISADDAQPAFYFIHSMLPHTPHILLPTGQLNGTRSEAGALDVPRALPGEHKDAWPDDGWAVAQNYQRHLLQLAFADRLLGEFLAHLKAVGLYDRTTIVVLSDHGTTFRPGLPRRDYTERSGAEIMRIPLLVKFAGGVSTAAVATVDAGGYRVTDMNVQTVDIAPTVAHAAGVGIPWETDGGSILDRAHSLPDAKVMYYDSARSRATLAAAGPDTAGALAWKRSFFDDPDNAYRVPRADAFDDLVGRQLADLSVAEGGGEVRVDHLADFQHMDLSANPVAFDVAGRLRNTRARGATYLAVAINGVIRAVTRTWHAAPGAWLATPPLTSWRNGRNTLEIFEVTRGERGPTLRRLVIRPGEAHD